MKKRFYTEWAYVVGIIALAFGTAFMERANFGMSMVVAPAYILHLKLSEYISWFTFGVSEYCFQALLLIVLGIVVRGFKKSFLFSFITAFIYGNVLDLCITIVGLIPEGAILQRIIFFIIGMCLCSIGVSMVFHTYIAPEAYELFVKEIAAKYNKNINVVKTVYDCTSCLIAILMSFAFMGFMVFKGVNWGTVVTALVNGWLIGRFSQMFEKNFEFKDALTLKKYFE